MPNESLDSDSEITAELIAYYADVELNAGRTDWLAEHILQSQGRIHPIVAGTIFQMIRGVHPEYELRIARSSALPPAERNSDELAFRDLMMAVEVARLNGFERGKREGACEEVASKFGLESSTVAKKVRPLQKEAVRILEAETLQQRYEDGDVDYLGRPILPLDSFDDASSDG